MKHFAMLVSEPIIINSETYKLGVNHEAVSVFAAFPLRVQMPSQWIAVKVWSSAVPPLKYDTGTKSCTTEWWLILWPEAAAVINCVMAPQPSSPSGPAHAPGR